MRLRPVSHLSVREDFLQSLNLKLVLEEGKKYEVEDFSAPGQGRILLIDDKDAIVNLGMRSLGWNSLFH